MRILALLVLLLSLTHADHVNETKGMVANECPSLPGLVPLSGSVVLSGGYCAYVFVSGLKAPRGMIRIQNDLLVIEKTSQSILLFTIDPLTFQPSLQKTLFKGKSLNHGIAYDETNHYLYASSTTSVYRWFYDGDTLSQETLLINGIPSGGHSTRTLLVDSNSNLYVSVGSAGNVDRNYDRAMVVRFDLTAFTTFPVNWKNGVKFAVGLRNEVGLAQDALGRIWGVENGVDNLNRKDLGGDIHSNNPGEELNLFEVEGDFYGYPFCWSEYSLQLPSGDERQHGPRTQWAQPEFLTAKPDPFTDEKCLKESKPPKYVAQAHMAPLGITFWDGGEEWADLNGDGKSVAIIAFHGSWNRSPAVGYRVDLIDLTSFNDGNGEDGIKALPLLARSGNSADGTGWIRPVNVATGVCPFGTCVYITDDRGGRIVVVGHP